MREVSEIHHGILRQSKTSKMATERTTFTVLISSTAMSIAM